MTLSLGLAVSAAQTVCAEPAAHTVTIDSMQYAPPDLTVKVGETVMWVNHDPYPHTVSAQSGGFDSKDIAPGESWRFTATRKGSFPYFCRFHRTMKGTLRVE
ncbi:cupredoxin family copper-binding protein [Pandoraea sp. XY-2]|uniref:cupredoxin domain-containing protein n=1 Tax=Pandoraea sp. XY-2 TaxID=2518599 RepID=UPI00101B1E54|nr:cupredoxin family copper-binding protein [Pandoraea sp. XY-2]QBC33638.1 copper-binding protein [Pandoraea sp. XY-2]